MVKIKRITRGRAIREMCIQCMGTKENTEHSRLIKDCTCETTCPLWRYRLGNETRSLKATTEGIIDHYAKEYLKYGDNG